MKNKTISSIITLSLVLIFILFFFAIYYNFSKNISSFINGYVYRGDVRHNRFRKRNGVLGYNIFRSGGENEINWEGNLDILGLGEAKKFYQYPNDPFPLVYDQIQ